MATAGHWSNDEKRNNKLVSSSEYLTPTHRIELEGLHMVVVSEPHTQGQAGRVVQDINHDSRKIVQIKLTLKVSREARRNFGLNTLQDINHDIRKKF